MEAGVVASDSSRMGTEVPIAVPGPESYREYKRVEKED
jgi:hypothetical protein